MAATPKGEQKELLTLAGTVFLLLAIWCLESLPSDEHQYPWALDHASGGIRFGIGWAIAAGIMLWRHPRRWGMDLLLSLFAVILTACIGFLWTAFYAFLIVGVG